MRKGLQHPGGERRCLAKVSGSGLAEQTRQQCWGRGSAAAAPVGAAGQGELRPRAATRRTRWPPARRHRKDPSLPRASIRPELILMLPLAQVSSRQLGPWFAAALGLLSSSPMANPSSRPVWMRAGKPSMAQPGGGI